MALDQYNRDYIKKQIPAEWQKFEKHLKKRRKMTVEDFFDNEGNEKIINTIKRKVKNFKL